ncbi:protoporphyrinogen/coproporphyrinogen oxidase [Campylobacter sp. RM12637]|uniref:protoporphyrinogen/coproporphyrinogen oxidase n=1 Tax=Campylobacter sp. RM12637 TaxID=2735734 RepID=UPI00301460BD|nr:NAD(P)-binding protein [Campylobacter sp. RM12637]
MDICIIGAGISGMSLARILVKNGYNVEILEALQQVGGIARTRDVNGIAYHINGGHCFNSKYDDVMDFVFNDILEKDRWNKINRNAKIWFKNTWISYPIEFAIKEVYNLDKSMAFNITKEMFEANYENGNNLEEWFINHFGKTLSREYFIPYNTKIWGIEPKNMDFSWIVDDKQMKLPVPSKESFFKGLIDSNTDDMAHACFYYPKTNNQNTFIDAFNNGSFKIMLNYVVEKIEYNNKKYIVNGEKKYDLLINTSPLNEIYKKIDFNIPSEVMDSFKKLKYNKVSNMLWETDGELDATWAYIPSKDNKIHRLSNIGALFRPVKNYCITESIGNISFDELYREGKKIKYLTKPLDYNVTEHAYVFFDLNYTKVKKICVDYLNSLGIISHGRFGEWEYYNMDICIKRSIDLSKKIISNYK